ncbi:hypothetical protein BBD33_10190 [Elizabethkingia meningoseptica]|nr:hypothetical protein BBD33_10190 [Elizabethkingia meningoseptica]AQX47638.1 hypothetical protein B5G46_10180 [Elizabethkingia meningoseptica]ODM55605.1 hypothetical protein BES09_03955 [Elizabethkingia meningoseptica]OHT30812.1 hypothetical protein BFF93_03960 [Elizabethkingia meningoseptica]OPB67701.1 hypothetical protein BAY30_10000 [Elizabethkingia meningoseptica]
MHNILPILLFCLFILKIFDKYISAGGIPCKKNYFNLFYDTLRFLTKMLKRFLTKGILDRIDFIRVYFNLQKKEVFV